MGPYDEFFKFLGETRKHIKPVEIHMNEDTARAVGMSEANRVWGGVLNWFERVLYSHVLPQPQPEVLYKCGLCGNRELYFIGAKKLGCNLGAPGTADWCPGIMIQMEPFPSYMLLPRPKRG